MNKRSTKDVWLDPEAAPVERLNAFHRWLSWRIAKLFNLERDQDKLIGQMKAVVLQAVRQLNEHGYLIDGPPLASLLEDKLRHVAGYQQGAKSLYQYFKISWDRFVTLRAEELKEDSMRLGMHISSDPRKWQPSIPELETQRHTESLREQLARARAREKRQEADRNQEDLFA